MIYETFREAIQNIWSNKFRTLLTMLGIIIGVMAVMVIVGLGNGMTTSIQNEFADMGTNLLTVQIMGYGSRSVKVKDFYELVEKNSDVLGAVSPSISMSGTVKVGTDDDSYSSTSVKGVSEVYLNMGGYTIVQGRPLNYVDMDANKKVCIVGDYISRVGYGGNAIGQSIKIGREWYTIVGVLEAEIDDPSDQEGSSDDCIFVPYTTAMRLSSQSTVNNYAAVMEDESRANEAKSAVESELQRLLGSDNGYYVYSASEWLEEMNNMINMVIVILTGIASISLLVGGIGIMNIMLVSVTERTRQIGNEIIEGKGSTEFGIGAALADMVKCILRDEHRVLPASVLLQGEYGQQDLHAGVPCVIGRDGIEDIIELPLNAAEQQAFEETCTVIRTHIARAAKVAAEA